MTARPPLAVAVLVLAAACGGTDTPAEPENAEAAPPNEDSNVFTPLTDTLDRAESVQSTIDARAEELRRRIEEAEE